MDCEGHKEKNEQDKRGAKMEVDQYALGGFAGDPWAKSRGKY